MNREVRPYGEKFRAETTNEIIELLNEIFFFLDKGPANEVLMDNSTAFLLVMLKEILDR